MVSAIMELRMESLNENGILSWNGTTQNWLKFSFQEKLYVTDTKHAATEAGKVNKKTTKLLSWPKM